MLLDRVAYSWFYNNCTFEVAFQRRGISLALSLECLSPIWLERRLQAKLEKTNAERKLGRMTVINARSSYFLG